MSAFAAAADDPSSATSPSKYCQQKYGTELDASHVSENRDAREFDPRCPTWAPLALGIAAFGTMDDLKKMLEAGLPPDDTEFFQPRHITLLDAAIRGNKIDTAKMLLGTGASAKKGYPVLSVFRPLSQAVSEQSYAQRLELLDLVLIAGADPNMPCRRDPNDWGPLMVAAAQADELSVMRLLKAGAKPDGVTCPGIPNYNEVMLPLFFKPFSQVPDDSLTDAQRAFLKKPISFYTDWYMRGTSALEIAIRGDWLAALKSSPKELEMWRIEEEERRARYRRVAARLVENGATAIGYFSYLELRIGDDPKLASIAIAAARQAGYDAELIAKLEEDSIKDSRRNRVTGYLAMLKNCKNKVMEARDDHFRLCASED